MLSGKTQNRIIALLLITVMLFIGCAQNTGEIRPQEITDAGEEAAGINLVSDDGSWKGEGGCYKLALPEINENVMGIYTDGEEIYALTIGFGENSIFWEIYRGEERIYQSSSINTMMAVGESGVWTLEDITDYTVGNDTIYHLLKVGSGTEEPFNMDVTQFIGDSHPTGIRMDKEGQLFIHLADNVIVFGQDGRYLNRIDMDIPANNGGGSTMAASGDDNTLVVGGDGKVYALSGDRGTVYGLDAGAESAVQAAEFPGYRVCDGGGDYLFTLVNENGLYGVRGTGGEAELIALWAELAISFIDMSSVKVMSEGRFLLKDSNGVYILKPADPTEIKPKVTLTMACVYQGQVLGEMVTDFNLWSDDYIVKIVDYSQGDKLSTREAITNLNTDIISGQYPDIFDFTVMTESFYTDKGLVADLYEFMDKDPDVKRDDFIFLDKMESSGRLYYAASHFWVDTVAGLWSRFGDRYGWTLDEYLEMQSQNSDQMGYVNKEGLLRTLTYRYAASAVDWEAGTCGFDTEEFIKILKSVADMRENPEPDDPEKLVFYRPGQIREGTRLILPMDCKSVRSLMEEEQAEGVKLSFIGWPTPDGSSGSAIKPSGLTGICAMGNKEGAWEFIKYLMTEGAEKNAAYGIPISRAVLDEQIEEAMNPSSTEQEAMNSEDVERLYDFLDNCVYLGTASDEVVNIVLEEASALFAGAKSAEDTAHIIQSRVGLLVAE